jgi:hypothetical protein
MNNFIDRVFGGIFELASAAAIVLFGGYFSRVIGDGTQDLFARSAIGRIVGKSKRGKAIIKAKVLGKAVRIWILAFFLMVSAEILRLEGVSRFLNEAVIYGGYAAGAVLIFFAIIFFADIFRQKIKK